MDYTAVGQTTHLAAQMEQLASPGAILLAPDTLVFAEGYVQVKGLGPVQVKGLHEPIEVYELLGAETAHSRLQAAAARGLTKFVGRDAELETLRRTLDQAAAGHGQIVALVGEAGVGKSRLVWEFSHSHRTEGWLVLASGSVSYGKATSYLPAIDLLKSYCGIEHRDDVQRIYEKLTGKLLTLDPALGPTLPALLSLLDMPVDDPSWQALDPPQRRQRTLDALKRLLLRESQRQPLLLVFEDLHWIDAETQALLDSLVDSLPATRILLLVNYRPEYEHTWHRKTYYQQLRLDPLPPESAEELMAALLGEAAQLDPLKHLLIVRTEGNPFFVEESVRTLVESGVLAGERGSYRLVRPFENTQVPATVQAVLAARIDRLAPEDKRLLQAASVIGKDVPYPLLQAVTELSENALQLGLTQLQTAEFLYEASLFPDPEYTFKHALTHEVAYGSLLQERRRALHARIVEAIEGQYPDRLAEHVERLAHHALRGERWEKAVGYLRQAGQKAQARSAYHEAVSYVEEALTALDHLPKTRKTSEQAIDLRLEIRNALHPLADFEPLVDHLREAETLAEALDDQGRLGWVSVHRTTLLWVMAEQGRALEAGRRALAIANTREDFALQVEAHLRLGPVYWACGDYAQAIDLFTWNITALEGQWVHERFGLPVLPAVLTRQFLVLCLAERGAFAEALMRAGEAVQIAEAVDHPLSVVVASYTVGIPHVWRGDFERGILLMERCLEVLPVSQMALPFFYIAPILAYAYARCGRLAEAVPLLEQAMEAIAKRFVTNYSVGARYLSEAYLLAGREREARDWADRARAFAQDHRQRVDEAWAFWLLGEIAKQIDAPEVRQAESYYRQAFALSNELGMRPLAAHCHLGLGTLYQKIGCNEQASAELTAAAGLYRAMEMTFWLEKAEAALAQLAS